MDNVSLKKNQISLLKSPKRIVMIDAMRGFALLGILLIHTNDYFLISGETISNQFHYPQLDPIVYRLLKILFGSKASTLFSLFLGYGFWIQYSNFKKKGYDFGPRYLWRLFILLFIGIFHAAFYSGDILVLYALIGGIVVLTRHWKDQNVFVLSLILLLNPYEIYQIVQVAYFGESRIIFDGYDQSVVLGNEIKNDGSFWQVVDYNFRFNIENNLISNLQSGKVLKFASVFLLGVLACRKDLLKIMVISFWKKVLLISIISYVFIFFLENYIGSFISNPDLILSLDVIISGIQSIFFTVALMAVFALAWILSSGKSWMNLLVPFGKMSLTNYVTQGIVGSFIFYGYGLKLYPYIGTVWCVFLSIFIFFIQASFSKFYLKHHKSGPLESFWRWITWIDKRKWKSPTEIKDKNQILVE